MRKPFVVTFAALSACAKDPEPATSPQKTPTQQPSDQTAEPAENEEDSPPAQATTNPPPAEGKTEVQLPKWEDVASGHPPGATNPPVPLLRVGQDGTCHKLWMSPMLMSAQGGADALNPAAVDCAKEDCGTPVQCPDEAGELLDGLKKP